MKSFIRYIESLSFAGVICDGLLCGLVVASILFLIDLVRYDII